MGLLACLFLCTASSELRLFLYPRTTTRAKTLNDSQARRNRPEKETKRCRGLGDLADVEAVAVERDLGRNRNRAGEPENGRDGEQGEADNGVV